MQRGRAASERVERVVYLASGSGDHTILVWSATTGEYVTKLRGHRLGVTALASIGMLLISGSADHDIR